MARSPAKVGWSVALALGAVFAGIGWAALGQGPLMELDEALAVQMRDYGQNHDLLRGAMIVFTFVGGIFAVMTLTFLAVLRQLGKREFALAGVWVVMVVGGALIDQGLKAWLGRPRPDLSLRDPVVFETNQSFPSGHAMGSLVGYGMVGYALCLRPGRRKVKVAGVVALGVVVVLVGFSRVFLRAHWLSDVLAGFVIGLAWLSLGVAWMESRRLRMRRRIDSPVLEHA